MGSVMKCTCYSTMYDVGTWSMLKNTFFQLKWYMCLSHDKEQQQQQTVLLNS